MLQTFNVVPVISGATGALPSITLDSHLILLLTVTLYSKHTVPLTATGGP